MSNLLTFGTSSSTPNKQFKQDKVFTEAMFHQACGHAVDALLMKAMKAQSLDNLSVVMIGLKGFHQALEKAF